MSHQILCLSLIGLFIFFLPSCLRYNPHIMCIIWKYFSHSASCLFTFLMVAFEYQNFLVLMKSSLSVLSFVTHLRRLTLFFLRFYLFIFRERRREGERERNINVWYSLVCPLLGTWPATQACALTGTPAGNPWVCRPALSPLSHTSQGLNLLILKA